MNTQVAISGLGAGRRLLLLFAPSIKSPAYEMQKRLLESRQGDAGHSEMATGEILMEGESRIGDRRIDASQANQLREHFGVSGERFSVILLNAEGNVERRADAPVETSTLYKNAEETLNHRSGKKPGS